ncbi:MAG TPA: glycosyltransferase family 4 protein [archaeon]|nr:glycosyltransferase family 4 protein [archaeon]
MLITLLATYYFPAGTATRDQSVHLASSLPELARFLVTRGHRVRAIARKTRNTPEEETVNGVEVHRVPVLELPWLRLATWKRAAAKKLRQLEAQEPSDIVLCWDWSATLPALGATRAPVVCSLRNSSEAWRHLGDRRFRAYRDLEHRAYSGAAWLIPSSHWADRTLRSVMHLDTPSTVLPHGIDTNAFSPSIDGSAARAALKLDGSVIGFFGRLDRAKAVDILLAAIAPIKGSWTLLIVGDGPERNALEAQARSLAIADRVVFAGFRPRSQVPEHMAACDIMTLPSRTEGFSSVVVEAIAMGKPLIATAVGGAPEVLDKTNGILVPADDPEALRSALAKLIADPALRSRLGAAARQTAERFAWPVVVEQWEQLLEKIAREAARARSTSHKPPAP